MAIHSVGITEAEEKYLKKHYNNEFSRYVHDAFKRDINLTNNNKKKNKLQNYAYNVIMLGLGAIFILNSLNATELLGFLLVFLLGVFLMSYSLVSSLVEVGRLGRIFNRK